MFTRGSCLCNPFWLRHASPFRNIGYWNKYNSSMSVTVPIENNARLIGGSVRLIAKVDGFAYKNIVTPTKTLTQSELDAGNYTFDVSAQDFEGTVATPTDWFADGNTVLISAVIEDKDGNETFGSESETTITIDETSPIIANYEISSISSTGGTVVPKYWNSTNIGFDVNIKILGVSH